MKKQKAAPWLAFDVAWWPEVVAVIPKPWPKALVLADLRWWEDQERVERAKRPGRPGLGKRWGWGDWKVRTILKGEEWKSPLASSLQPSSSSHPARIQKSSEPLQKSTAKPAKSRGRPSRKKEVPSSRHPAVIQPDSTRADLQNNKGTEHRGSKSPRGDLSPLWEEINSLRKRFRPSSRKWRLNEPRKRELRARIREHSPEDILRVVEWWLCSPHPRATFLREKGSSVDTILRPSNFAGYLEMTDGPQEQVAKSVNGKLSPMDALRQARADRELEEIPPTQSGTLVPFRHPIPK